jgi:sugar lactone lactonase YvrE
MILTKQTQHKIFGALLASVLVLSSPAHADDYRDARAELIAAYQQEDYPAMLVAANKALAARPGFPGAIFNLAMTQAVNGDPQASLLTLESLLKKGVDFGAAELGQFAAVRELDGWRAYEANVDALHVPFGTADVVTNYDDASFVPEGIAFDNEGRLYLGSIHRGQIVRLGETAEVLSDRDTHWSVFGSRFHSDGSLWFASAAVPQMTGVGEDEGKTGLFRLDVSSGTITKSAILPQYEKSQVLGDLIIADDNTIYATDSLTGAIYRYYIDSNEFEILVQRGKLGSPQGLALDASGSYLYVADYIGGLYRVWLKDGSLVRLNVADDTTTYGIDGLYRYGDELVVIQNGIRPNRVAAMQLSDNGLAITGSRLLVSNLEQFDEPTLGVIRGDDFYFVANSHWNRFNRENELPEGLIGPIILRIQLKH